MATNLAAVQRQGCHIVNSQVDGSHRDRGKDSLKTEEKTRTVIHKNQET